MPGICGDSSKGWRLYDVVARGVGEGEGNVSVSTKRSERFRQAIFRCFTGAGADFRFNWRNFVWTTSVCGGAVGVGGR